MEYKFISQENGDYEVWRKIIGSNKPEEHVATFHNYAENPSVNVAKANAKTFCEDQNERERLLCEVIGRLHDV